MNRLDDTLQLRDQERVQEVFAFNWDGLCVSDASQLPLSSYRASAHAHGVIVSNFDRQYQQLREAGLSGWGGENHQRNMRNLADTLDRLEERCLLPKPPARMLELGCGNGMSSFLLAKKGYEAYGVDRSEVAVSWARERFAEAGLIARLYNGDVCSMPFFGSGFFDVVIDGSCLHCLIGEDRVACLSEVRRTLRIGGIFVVSSMCGFPKSKEAQDMFDATTGHLVRNGWPYRTLKPKKEIETEISHAGFQIHHSEVAVNPWWDHATIVCTC